MSSDLSEPRSQVSHDRLQPLLARSLRVIKEVTPLLPRLGAVSGPELSPSAGLDKVTSRTAERYRQIVEDGKAAQARGYFMPDEDDRIRAAFAEYLRLRVALRSIITELKPHVPLAIQLGARWQAKVVAVAFAAACLRYESARFWAAHFKHSRVVRKKLDEASSLWRYPRKQFTHIYRSQTSPRKIVMLLFGAKYVDDRREVFDELASDPTYGPLVEIIREPRYRADTEWQSHFWGRLAYRWFSFRRRHHSAFKNTSFALFRTTGSFIAELRDKQRLKRVTPEIQTRLAELLRPGDVIITRHDDATSNLFLPGFWPHAALYIGSIGERKELGVEMSEDIQLRSGSAIRVLEARKDGVLLRPLAETFDVDCVTVIRPRLTTSELAEGLGKALTHEGKGYDFEFDFRRSEQLVCTEVAYRAFHGIGRLHFDLRPRAGRLCLSAEDLLNYALHHQYFDVIALFGVPGDELYVGEPARKHLMDSFEHGALKPVENHD